MQQLEHSAMHEGSRRDAFQNDGKPCSSEIQLVLAWSVSFKTTTTKLA